MVKTFVIAAFVIGFITNYAHAGWTYYDYLNCNLKVESWYNASFPENDTDGEFGITDVDRIQTVGESSTITNRIDIDSKYNIISISIPTYFYNLSGHTSYPTMYVTIISDHATDPTQDYYFHSNAIAIHPSTVGGDEMLYTIGAVIDPSGVTQSGTGPEHRSVTVLIEIVAPMGVQHLVSQVRVNSTANYTQPGGACAH